MEMALFLLPKGSKYPNVVLNAFCSAVRSFWASTAFDMLSLNV